MPPQAEAAASAQRQGAAIDSGRCICCGGVIGPPPPGLTTDQAAKYKEAQHCERCFGERFLICPCGKVSPYIDMTPVRVGEDMRMVPVCLSCFDHLVTACNRCGRPFQRLPDDPADVCRCPKCRNVAVCELCNEEVDGTNASRMVRNEETGGMKICPGCYEKSTKPAPAQVLEGGSKVHFLPAGEGPGYIGVELEVEVHGENDYHQTFLKVHELTKSFCIVKRDGSLSHGFEIVSRPASFAVHKSMWTEFLEKRPPCLRSYDTTTCGMHVHYSKKALTSLQLGKVLVFVNEPANRSFVVAIAGREPCTYCQMQPKKIGDATGPPGARYQAINLIPKSTVEFRLFKGTLNPKSFHRNIEFVHAITQACKTPNESVPTVAEFKAFVAERTADYPNLHDFIIKTTPTNKKKKG